MSREETLYIPDDLRITSGRGVHTVNGIDPNTHHVHVVGGEPNAVSEALRWLGWFPKLSDLDRAVWLVAPKVPAQWEPGGARSWCQEVLGRWVHPETGEVVGWAYRFTR